MFIEMIKTEGLAHLSYVVGDGRVAAVIDPRRDVAIYEAVAQKYGVGITHIFETHRNEDLVTGSENLVRRTGAIVLHGPTDEYDVPYAKTVHQGERVELGETSLTVLETPGHTLDSISIVVRHTETGDSPLGVFTGDALFVNDVGRTDFYPDRAEEVAGLLYDSLHDKLLPLGDQTIVYPAHGAGSVCGQGMADRNFSTIGYEKLHNPRLRLSRAGFVEAKTGEHHDSPPYFSKMEEVNASFGGSLDSDFRKPAPMSVEDFASGLEGGLIAVDLRAAEGFAGGHLPGSLSLPLAMLTSFAGWLLPYNVPIGLIAASAEEAEHGARALARIGYDQVAGYLDGGIAAWAVSGRSVEGVTAIDGPEFKGQYEGGAQFVLLDVRAKPEFEQGHLEGATHIYLGELPERLDELDPKEAIITFCGSGQRALIAASVLKRSGFEKISVNWGSMGACETLGCKIAT